MIDLSYKLFFQTLSNANRWKIVNLLQSGERNVSQICKELKIEQSTVSHALKRLERCGFVTLKPNGKERIYSVNQKTFFPLLKLMKWHMNSYCKPLLSNKDLTSVASGPRLRREASDLRGARKGVEN